MISLAISSSITRRVLSVQLAPSAWRKVCPALAAMAIGSVHGAEPTLPGTAPLTGNEDRSAEMLGGMERSIDGENAALVARRDALWQRDPSSPGAYAASVAPNRERFRKIIGVVETRVANPEPHYIGTTSVPAKIAESALFTAYAVRWPVYENVEAEGLLLEPKGEVKARVVALPEADQTPEQISGLAAGLAAPAQFARRLAENGCQVLIPTLVNRGIAYSRSALAGRTTNQSHREWIYRQAYTFGRHIIGYEVHQVQAAVDWFARQNAKRSTRIGVVGWGEGGLLAFYSAAVDPRIDAALVSGYFGPREQLWDEPMYRNCFSLLREFGDAEIASLILPRVLIVEAAGAPDVPGPRPGAGGSAAAGRIVTPPFAAVRGEAERARKLGGLLAGAIRLRPEQPAGAAPISEASLLDFLEVLSPSLKTLMPSAELRTDPAHASVAEERQHRRVAQLEAHTQRLIEQSRGVRDENFWKPLTISTPEAWDKTMQPLRDSFWTDIMGRLPRGSGPFNARSRLLYDRADSIGYEVIIEVLPDVPLWGYLLLPKNLTPDERRPVVVAQHGRSGVPADLINEDPAARAYTVYKAFALQLVRRGGYVVFVPHFPWRGGEDYNRLQRKANPLGLSVFSFVLAHHQRLLDWLEEQAFVDRKRIGLYGLSWGGKVALRVPALEQRYALSICSGDFNEWIWKNATTAWRNSYMFAPEPDIFDFNLGMTYGHAEMAAMIAPRPFMVERGHDDGVGIDEMVALEYARVRRLYDKLQIGPQTEIEFFNGIHQINAVGTFNFLQRQFHYPPGGPKP